MPFTFAQLAKIISEMTDEQKNSDVTVYDNNSDEYFQAQSVEYCNNGVLDNNHPFISYNAINKLTEWTKEHDKIATAQGWSLVAIEETFKNKRPQERAMVVQRIDIPEDGSDPVFNDDFEALAFVREQAKKGDKTAQIALEYDNYYATKVGWDQE